MRVFNKKALRAFALVLILFFICTLDVNVLAAKPDRKAPSAPTNLRALTVDDTFVSLEWNPSMDNVGVKSYEIYKDYEHVGSSDTTRYSLSGLTAGTTYNFYVVAKDAAGNTSRKSNILTITTLLVPTKEPTPEPTPKPVSSKRVVGYYAAWSAYSGFTPDKLDVSKLTHINYAFANIGSDLKITLGYPDVDISNFNKLNALKQSNPSLKTLIAVGGWSWSGKFSDVALTEASRSDFADSCVDFIVKYGFDGVDIDWEYPVSGGLSTNVKRPEDKKNFTLLMQKLREKLDVRGQIDGKKYLLTFAGASGSWYMNNTELGLLIQYVDFGNVMTYDIHGTWDKYTDFNSPLYDYSSSALQYKWSVDSSVKAWKIAGFPGDKIVVGVPFYGHKYNSVVNMNNGLFQSFSDGSAISYDNIIANYLNAQGYVRYFHQGSMVPWLFNGTTFISYDDEESIGYKAAYIKNNALGGAMIWELSQDKNRVLLNALFNGLQ